MALLNNGFRCIYYYSLMLCWLFSVSYVYAADIQAIKSPAFIQQEQLIKKIIQDLDVYQKKLEQLAKNSQDLDVKYSQEFERYKDLIANFTKDIVEHQETIVGLEGKNDAEFNHYKDLITSISEDIAEHQRKLKGLDVTVADIQMKTRGYDKNQKNINKAIDVLEKDMKDVRFKTASINKQKALIEENSIRLYEVLVDVRARYEYLFSEFKQLKLAQELYNGNLYQDKNKVTDTSLGASTLQQFLSIIFLFFIPLAFSFRQTKNMILKDGMLLHQTPILITAGVLLGYFMVGYGLMYGDSLEGFIGISNSLFLPIISPVVAPIVSPADALYQVSFVLLAAMVVSQIVGQELSSAKHLVLALFVSIVLIPVFGHWVWADEGWLAANGFIDEMGAIVVNTLPAWFAFVILYQRRGMLEITTKKMDVIPLYQANQVILLWLVWFGLVLNTASDRQDVLPHIILNVFLAGAAGSLGGFFYHAFFHADASRISRASGGFMSGLVAIAGCAHAVVFPGALIIGVVAGVLHNLATNFLRKHFLREVSQANAAQLIAIHGFCGIWGAISLALFGSADGFGGVNIDQLFFQLQGIMVVLIYATLLGLIVAKSPFQRRKKPQVV